MAVYTHNQKSEKINLFDMTKGLKIYLYNFPCAGESKLMQIKT